MLPMAFSMPMPFCAVISCGETEGGGGLLIVKNNFRDLTSFIINHLL